MLGILVAVTVLVLGLLALSNWLSNRPATATAAIDQTNLLPLAEPVNPIAGFHDMEHMPNPNAPGRPVDAGVAQANVDLPCNALGLGRHPAHAARPAESFPSKTPATSCC